MKSFVFSCLLTGSAAASVTFALPGTTAQEGWDGLNSSNYSTGFPTHPTTGNPWPNAIAANVAGSAGSATFNKVSGGGYFASSSLYDAGLGGIYQIADPAPLASISNIILQVDAGTYVNVAPVLNYNGGSQALSPDFFTIVNGDYLSGFGGPPETTSNHIWQWDTSGLGISSYDISWGSEDNDHLTQYEVNLSTSDEFVQAVPEPSVVLLASLVPFVACLRRRRVSK